MTTDRAVTHWRIADMIDVLDIVSPPEAGTMHCHPTYNIGAVLDGHATVECDGHAHEQPTGSTTLFNAFDAHASAWYGERNHYFVINIGEATWQRLCMALGDGHQPLQLRGPISRDQIIFHMMLGLREELLSRPENVGLDDIAALLATIARRGFTRDDETAPLEALDAFRDRLSLATEQGEGPLRIEELAGHLDLSRFQFSRLLRNMIGLQPRRLRLQLMVATAQSEIVSGVPLSSAAMNAGFSDQSHMNREFRRTLGITPREYQRVVRPGIL
ncbi:AraC family transcriptional regulator [Tropicimonas sp. IMCC34043]|uniref:helix-turn-helix transcriptional regulator n=1 Tax=Tropicimonas sp. IMCC34043 TaxID=2248760 RepID=UPI0013004EDD|nr:AraC family transcriptional regulator [Tropicimonas sp. IMCC34043]